MAPQDEKFTSDGKTSPVSSEEAPVEVGQTYRRRFGKFSLEVRQEESSFAKTKNASNADFDPIPPSKRTWGWGAYIAYWMADAWAVSNWEVGEFETIVGIRYDMTEPFLQLLPSSLLVLVGGWPLVLACSVMLSWVSSSRSTAESVPR